MAFDRDLARDQICRAALPYIAFDGWTGAVLARAAEDAGYEALTALRVFPGGAIDAIEHWCAMADRAMVEACADDPAFAALKVREKIATAIRRRLAPLAGDREAVRRALGVLALPTGVGVSLKTVWRTVDAVWYLAGDTATDFNFYSKRGLAAGCIRPRCCIGSTTSRKTRKIPGASSTGASPTSWRSPRRWRGCRRVWANCRTRWPRCCRRCWPASSARAETPQRVFFKSHVTWPILRPGRGVDFP